MTHSSSTSINRSEDRANPGSGTPMPLVKRPIISASTVGKNILYPELKQMQNSDILLLKFNFIQFVELFCLSNT